MHRLRMSMRENRLRDLSRVTEADYLPYLRQEQASWVAELDGRLVGFAIADLKNRSIWALFVSPDSEGRGVGRALLNRVTDCLKATGSGPMHLVTEAGTRAERLYAAAGWVKAGMQPSGEIRYERDH
jgi:GNAT superfamily N-acetyltransferase